MTQSRGATRLLPLVGALLSFLWQQRETLERREFTRLFWGAGVFAAITIFLGFQIPGIDNGAHISAR